MSNTLLLAYITLHSVTVDAAERTKKRLSDDSGEMGSYLILAAGLVAAAVLVVASLKGWFTKKAGEITKN